MVRKAARQFFDDSKRSEGKVFSWIIYVALSQNE
jgi:hypothetical protein